ncbi:MAG: hypothetical protein WC263_04770 [Candidatus Micrarchaeia archaeon]|jgi:hypothetical protein
MDNAESDYSGLMDKPFPKKPEQRPALELFYGKLRPHEKSMLYVICNEPKDLAAFATKQDSFYSQAFRRACSSVLREVHKTTAQKQLAKA